MTHGIGHGKCFFSSLSNVGLGLDGEGTTATTLSLASKPTRKITALIVIFLVGFNGAVAARNRQVSRYGLLTVSDEGVRRHGVLNRDENETKIVEKGERDGREIWVYLLNDIC